MSDINARVLAFHCWLDDHPEIIGQRLPMNLDDPSGDDGPAPIMHVSWQCVATDPLLSSGKDDCVAALKACLDILGGGCKGYIRVAPEVIIEKDFMANRPVIKGYVRFAVTSKPGGWETAPAQPPQDGIRYVEKGTL